MANITLKNFFDAIRGNYNGEPNKVQVSGRNVEEIVVFDSLAVTDTEYRSSSTLDLSKYNSFSIMARMSLDQDIHVRLVSHDGAPDTRLTQVWDDVAGEFNQSQVTVPAMTDRWFAIHTHPTVRDFIRFGLKEVRIGLRTDVAPTQGSITLIVWGVIN